MKNILFLVTGMTPQIITETLWALACDPNNDEHWVPDEVHVMSTEHGLNQIQERLINQGNFQQLLTDYQLADILFDSSCLHSINDVNNQPLADLKTPEDNELAADAISQKIREFTQDDKVSLHVSIAGGRKTMGFYAGYALSLYGRAQDSMSHVLVDERYEQAVDFYYPSPSADVYAKDRDGKVIGRTKNAKIWLANIPFVRMKEAIKSNHQLQSDDSFSEVVGKVNESFNDVTLQINLHSNDVCVNNQFTFKLAPRHFAFLRWFAELRKDNQLGVLAPTASINKKNITEKELATITTLNEEYKKYYEDLKSETDVMVDKNFFNDVKSRLHTALQDKLGLELAAKIAIQQDKKGMPFYLNLLPESISIVDTF